MRKESIMFHEKGEHNVRMLSLVHEKGEHNVRMLSLVHEKGEHNVPRERRA
jgi:hypothetical protein